MYAMMIKPAAAVSVPMPVLAPQPPLLRIDDELLGRLLETFLGSWRCSLAPLKSSSFVGQQLSSRDFCALRRTCRRLRDSAALDIAATSLAERQMLPGEGVSFDSTAAVRL